MPDKKKKKRSFFTDIWRKVIAIGLAVFVWYAINQQVSTHYPEYDVVVPLKLECADESVILPEKTPNVTLRVKTSLAQQELVPDRFEVRLPIRESYESIPDNGMLVNIHGNSRFLNTKRPPFTRVVSYSINASVFIDKRVVKKVPVAVKFTGKLAAGLVPGFIVSPSDVLIEGPSSALMDVNQVHTEKIDISDAKDGIVFDPLLDIVDRRVKLHDRHPDETVNVKLKAVNPEKLDTIVLNDLPVRVLCPTPQKIMLKNGYPLKATVTFSAEMGTLAAIKAMDVKPYIDISGVGADRKSAVLPLQIDLPIEVSDKIFNMVKSPSEFKVEFVPVVQSVPLSEEDENGTEK